MLARVDLDEGGNQRTWRKPSTPGWDQRQLRPRTVIWSPIKLSNLVQQCLTAANRFFFPEYASDNTSKLKLTWLTKGFRIPGKFWNENTES